MRIPKPARKSRPRRKRKGSMAALRRRLWAALSAAVKEHYGPTCYTCGASGLSGSNLHAGHFVNAGLSAATRYDPDNVRPQCMRCNVWLRGNVAHYSLQLHNEIGAQAVREMVERSAFIVKWTRADLETLCDALPAGWYTYSATYDLVSADAIRRASVRLVGA